MRGNPEWRVGRTVSLVAFGPRDDLEKQPACEGTRVALVECATGILVVENRGVAQFPEQVVRKIEPRTEVVVIFLQHG